MTTTVTDMKIEPCILVRDRITVNRGVSYVRTNLTEEVRDDGSEDATWTTDRHYRNKAEAKLAESIYNKARARIASVCVSTDIGFVCPVSRKAELDQAITDARGLVDEFNRDATVCRVNFKVVCTNIDTDNKDGMAVIQDSLTDSVMSIRQALENFDTKGVREALKATKQMVTVISDPAVRAEMSKAREEVNNLCAEIRNVLKEFDGNVQNALVSENGVKIVERISASWNF